MSQKVRVALQWLKDLLETKNVQYQIAGGLAAKIHGVDLIDIQELTGETMNS